MFYIMKEKFIYLIYYGMYSYYNNIIFFYMFYEIVRKINSVMEIFMFRLISNLI